MDGWCYCAELTFTEVKREFFLMVIYRLKLWDVNFFNF